MEGGGREVTMMPDTGVNDDGVIKNRRSWDWFGKKEIRS
jgi:hypothetical protein